MYDGLIITVGSFNVKPTTISISGKNNIKLLITKLENIIEGVNED